MIDTKPAMKMPELLVFARFFATGFVGTEVWRAAFYLGTSFASLGSNVAPLVKILVIFVGVLLCLTYAINRGALVSVERIGRSFRVDLLIVVGVGMWANTLASPLLVKVHIAIKGADSHWAPAVLLLLCAILSSPLIQKYLPRRKRAAPQLYFLADEEIGTESEDLLESERQAKSFAETVLASGAHSGLVFGVDGPWGVGKTSFINLAERYWASEKDRAIVCRFEPLRYASEPDLADRLIRDLSAAIQKKVFAPEFRPAASRYSRLIKGKADVSFLGFKLSLEPSQETIDELLDDIDEVLRRINRRVIIVIDDLDRLDAKTTNNVLFATRRTFNLSQATYVLCYDTEVLVEGKEEGARAREFLEKFVTVKLSLFVDSSNIRDFLLRDWQREDQQLGSIPSDTMLKLGAVLNELADILDGALAAKYLPLIGDLRKVKRFINAMLLVQLEKNDLGRTDFNRRDLINLMLLHLNYPGVFRQIYAEETEGRCGTFAVRHERGPGGTREFKNSRELLTLIEEQKNAAAFLLTQLFDVAILELGDPTYVEEAVQVSRACFNEGSSRNLEQYLKLIVRFATPEPQNTFVLYQKAVDQVKKGESIDSILTSHDFRLEYGNHAHDQFWRILVNQSHDFTLTVAENAIDTLVDYLPRYSMVANNDRGLRQRSIYALLRLLNQAGWGRTLGTRRPNTAENVIEIAWRIFGEHSHIGKGLIQRLASNDRGPLGWNDLMIFRLQCSADRQGQLYNLHTALIVDQHKDAATTGLVRELAVIEMRKLSQTVFALFKETYIGPQRNFLAEVNNASAEAFVGQSDQDTKSLTQRISAERSTIKSFVIYQLSNSIPPNGSGVGCGYYDEHGADDRAGIAKLMNEYMFGVCFNPNLHADNIFHFLDHCLSHLSNSFFSDRDESGYLASKAELPGGLDPRELGTYWRRHRETIKQRASNVGERLVITYNYHASYGEDLGGVFTVLDELAEEAAGERV
jgi:hypothetical protein